MLGFRAFADIVDEHHIIHGPKTSEMPAGICGPTLISGKIGNKDKGMKLNMAQIRLPKCDATIFCMARAFYMCRPDEVVTWGFELLGTVIPPQSLDSADSLSLKRSPER